MNKKYSDKTPEQLEAEVESLYELFHEYYDAYAEERSRLDRCERMYHAQHWADIPEREANEPRPVTPVIHSTIENVRADLMDYLPEAIITADSRPYDSLAELMTSIVKKNHIRCRYDDEYALLTHDLIVGGYSVQEIGFDPEANEGIGGAFIRQVDNRSIMFDPLATELQTSRAVFKFSHRTRDWFTQHYPEIAPELTEDGYLLDIAEDDLLTPRYNKSIMLIEAWVREYDADERKYRVHMLMLAGGKLLEDSRRVRPEGYFAHGEYPFIITTLFPRKGSCLGYGFVDMYSTMQQYSDKLDQIVMKNALLASHNKLLITGASGFDSDDLRDWSKDIHVGDNLNGVTWFSTAPLPSYLVTYVDEIRNSIKEESGANEFARGMTHAGVTSGTAIAALQEASSKRSRMCARQIHSGFRQAVTQELEVEKQFTLRKRCEAELGSLGKSMGVNLEKLSSVRRALDELSVMPTALRVSVKVVKENAFNILNNNETVFRLVASGMITPSVGLELLIFDGKDEAIELMKNENAASSTDSSV